MKAWGIGSLDEPGSIGALARMVQDHEHFAELLRACEPQLRKDMYNAMSPNLNFPAYPLETYIIQAKQHAESMQYPTMDAAGNLHAYNPPAAGAKPAIEIPEEELWLQCAKCKKESFFYAERKADCITEARKVKLSGTRSTFFPHVPELPGCNGAGGFVWAALTYPLCRARPRTLYRAGKCGYWQEAFR